MKKRSLLLILALTISLAMPIFLTQSKPVYTAPIITPTKTYQIPETLNVTTTDGTNITLQVNFTVTTNIGVLIAGNVAGVYINIGATCYTPNATGANVTGIIINSNSTISTTVMYPISSAFGSNVNMAGPIPLNQTLNLTRFTLPPASENVYLLSDTVGFPAQLSFALSATVEATNGTKTETKTYSLDSASHGGSALSFVLPNPSETPQVINYYTYGLLILVFLLPITLVLTDWRLKIRRLKKESEEGV